MQFFMLLGNRVYKVEANTYDDYIFIENIIDINRSVQYDLDDFNADDQIQILEAAEQIYHYNGALEAKALLPKRLSFE
jgi:hypothetical protein